MNQPHWQNGQTIADILDLLMYSPSSDKATSLMQDRADKRNEQAETVESRQVDDFVEQHRQADTRAMRRPYRIA